MMTKTLMRARFRELERNRPADEVQSASRMIGRRLAELEVFRSARCLGAFLSLPSEVQTSGILADCWDRNIAVAVPYYVEDTRQYAMSRLERSTRLVTRKWGVAEPAEIVPVDPADLDLILVPAMAFDLQGVRLGHGGGHYDRLLTGVKRAFRLGLAFQSQIVDQLPREPHDQPVHAILTEQKLIEVIP